jgi:hypothetical protein
MAGNFAADYTGILSVPAVEHRVIPAFARCIKQMNWARLNLECIRISEPRLRLLLAHFPKANFQVDETGRMNDNINNNLCPFAQLPGDWDAYLDTLSANTRQKIRRLLRLLDTSDEYRITYATNLTAALTATHKADFVDQDDDHPNNVPPVISPAGWSKDGSFLVNDAYDVWSLAMDGSGGKRLTDGARPAGRASRTSGSSFCHTAMA